MRTILIAAVLMASISAKAQEQEDPIVHPRPTSVFVTINPLFARIDSLEARIKALEARPYISVLPAPNLPNRGIWVTAPGHYSLLIKSFNYTLYTDSALKAKGYNQTTY